VGEIGNLVRGLMAHPIAQRRPVRTAARIAGWQALSSLSNGPHTMDWINKSKLVVSRGMAGATGNLYYGLHEFADMAFVLHLLRDGDTFYDIGANVGSYTVLASAVAGARTEAFEPVPATLSALRANVDANAMQDRVTVHGCALGSENGSVSFTAGFGPENRVAQLGDIGSISVPIMRLDDALPDGEPILMKVDVEGHEEAMFAGAQKTMARTSLLAVEIETLTDNIRDMLIRLGFERVWYDPMARKIESQQGLFRASNALYVRDRAKAQARVCSAPITNIMGVAI
jgi:FkbM family methyltransferase